MTQAETLYHEIAAGIPDAKESKMFGALCIKAPNGKAAVMFWKECMIFKLTDKDEAEAMKLKGAKTFAPMDGREMKGWTQLSYDHAAKWPDLAKRAFDYVKKLEENKPKTAK
ncbi:MAG: hypothetical protein JSS82_18020 [Bacteroidetes bacterium]|nr:hypothetical protein [Bacteroidota bacterium]